MPDRIVAFVNDFKLGTRIAEKASQIGKEVIFPEPGKGFETIDDDTQLVIIDLDMNEPDPATSIKQLKNVYPNIPLAGISASIRKSGHDNAKRAGCDWIFSKSSFIKSMVTLLEKI